MNSSAPPILWHHIKKYNFTIGQLIFQTQENQQLGNQQLMRNAEEYPEGVYYYRIKAGDAVANGKMVKVK